MNENKKIVIDSLREFPGLMTVFAELGRIRDFESIAIGIASGAWGCMNEPSKTMATDRRFALIVELTRRILLAVFEGQQTEKRTEN